jgi:hypothetical protein
LIRSTRATDAADAETVIRLGIGEFERALVGGEFELGLGLLT